MIPKQAVHKDFEIEAVLRAGRGSRPHVYRVSYAGNSAVLKDFDGCDKWFALAFGRMLAARESAALAALNGVNGVPEFIATVGSRALLMKYVDARPAVKVHAGDDAESIAYRDVDWQAFIVQLESLVQRLHGSGVAHGDLRSPLNTLVTVSGEPVLVDFTAAFLRGGWPVPGRRWAFDRLCEIDRSAVIKMALRVHPQSVSGAELARHQHRGWLNRSARRAGQSIRWLSRLLTRG